MKPIFCIFKLGRLLADSCWPIPNVFFLLRAHHVLLFVFFSCLFLTHRNHKRRLPLDDSPPATNYVNARMLHALQVWRIFIQICWHRHFVKVEQSPYFSFFNMFFSLLANSADISARQGKLCQSMCTEQSHLIDCANSLTFAWEMTSHDSFLST